MDQSAPAPDAALLAEDWVPSEPWAPRLSEKQFRVLNSKARIILLAGPRKTGKSVAAGHKVCRHIWDVNRAQVGIFVTSYKVGTQGGSWQDLIDICMPDWLASGIVSDDGRNTFEYVTETPEGKPGPKLDGKTRTPFFEIKNRHGTTSSVHLFSVDNENEIESKVKQLRLSMVWIVELSTFGTRDIFRLTLLQLRSMHCPYEDQQWISDTNPSEEGTDSWIYKMFYQARNKPEEEKDEQMRAVLSRIEVIELYLDDNPFLRPEEVAELKWTYSDDPEGYDRHVLGKWIKSSGRRGFVFADAINQNIHFVPDAIDLDPDTNLIYTGWDPGIFNSAAVAGERRFVNGHAMWMILEEHVVTDHEISVGEFAVEFYTKLLELERFYREQRGPGFKGFRWEHWSDPNVSTLHHPSLSGAASAEILNVTRGQVELNAAIKGAGSVEAGCKFIRRLLREERLFVGRNCPLLIEALESIKHGTREFIDRDDKYKHVIDALRYMVTMVSLDELEDQMCRPKSTTRRLIHIGL